MPLYTGFFSEKIYYLFKPHYFRLCSHLLPPLWFFSNACPSHEKNKIPKERNAISKTRKRRSQLTFEGLAGESTSSVFFPRYKRNNGLIQVQYNSKKCAHNTSIPSELSVNLLLFASSFRTVLMNIFLCLGLLNTFPS